MKHDAFDCETGGCPECESPEVEAEVWDDHRPDFHAAAGVANEDTAADRLAGLLMDVEQAKYDLRLAAGALKSAGWSWGQVGSALGVSKQAAAVRFKGAAEEWATVYGHADGQAYDEEGIAEARATVRRVHRLLSIRPQRVRYEVRVKATGEVVSRHYVPERARLAAGQELVEIDPRKPDYRRERRIRSVK